MEIRKIDEIRNDGYVDLGVCLIGKNLNHYTIRGYASAAKLAVVSGPDTFDQILNELGTQRALTPKHSREAGRYALEARNANFDLDARTFPEVLMNVRALSLLKILDAKSNRELVVSELGELLEPTAVRVLVDFNQIEFPINPFSPQISRIDGNHRLAQMSLAFLNGEVALVDFPSIPFSLYLGLTRVQETKLFIDVNKNHKGMSTNLLLAMGSAIGRGGIQATVETRSDRLTVELAKLPIFEGLVDFGGDKTGFVDAYGSQAPLTLSLLRMGVKSFMSKSATVSVLYRADERTYLRLMEMYFTALQQVFPEMWGDKKEFILFKAIGVIGFSQFGGYLVERLYAKPDLEISDFIRYLSAVARRVDLSSGEWIGIAGSSGGKRVFDACIIAISSVR
jgi:DGQHR domain-containing protein